MTLNFFSDKPPQQSAKQHDAVLTVSTWMMGRPFLPRDLLDALCYLIPDLKEKPSDGFEHP